MRDDDDHLRLECDGVIRKRSKECIQMQRVSSKRMNARWIHLFNARNTCDTNSRTFFLLHLVKTGSRKRSTSSAECYFRCLRSKWWWSVWKPSTCLRRLVTFIVLVCQLFWELREECYVTNKKLVSSLLWLPEYMQHQSTNMHVLHSLTTWYYAHRIFFSG